MRNFFYGWYFKCQSATQTLAVIPAVHKSEQKKFCSIQIITEHHSWKVDFPVAAFHRTGEDIRIGQNSRCRVSFSRRHRCCVMEGQRISAGNLFGGKSSTGSEWETSNCSGRFGVRSKIAGGSQAPS